MLRRDEEEETERERFEAKQEDNEHLREKECSVFASKNANRGHCHYFHGFVISLPVPSFDSTASRNENVSCMCSKRHSLRLLVLPCIRW